MKVVVVLEFPDITDPNSAEATEVVDALTLDTLRTQEEWADKSARVWVETVEGESMTEATGWTCPHCGRVYDEYDDIDGPPCPSDDCPSHEGEESAEMTPHERALYDALRDLLSATQRVYDNRHEYDAALDAVEMVRLAKE